MNWIRDRINNSINLKIYIIICILELLHPFNPFSSANFLKGVDRSRNPERDALRWNRWNCVSSGQVISWFLEIDTSRWIFSFKPPLSVITRQLSWRKNGILLRGSKIPDIVEGIQKLALSSLISSFFRQWRASRYRKGEIIKSV